jgi:hypothetical protein
VCISAIFLFLGVVLLVNLRKTRLVLRRDSVAMHDLFSTRELNRDEIKGFRIEVRSKGASSTVLVPRSGDRRKVNVPHIFDFDDSFYEWLEQFSDIGAEEAAAAQAEMENNSALGATPEERAESLKQARLSARTLSIAAVIVSIWGWFFPTPYRVVVFVLVAMPWLALALAMRYRGLFRVDQKQNDPHPSIALPFLFPGLVLAIRVLYDLHMIGWQKPLVVALFIDLLLCATAMKLDSTLAAKKQIILLFLISIGYGFGAGLEANALLDRSPAQIYEAKVLSKRISRGKTTTYHLTLSAWGPLTHNDEVTVFRDFYESLQAGDTACVVSHQGALGMPWYVVRYCR